MNRTEIEEMYKLCDMDLHIAESYDGDQIAPSTSSKKVLNIEQHSAIVERVIDSEDEFASLESEKLSYEKVSIESEYVSDNSTHFELCPVSEVHKVNPPVVEVTVIECVSDNQQPEDVVVEEKKDEEFVTVSSKEYDESIYEFPEEGKNVNVKYALVLPDHVYDVPRKRCGQTPVPVHGQTGGSMEMTEYNARLKRLERTDADVEEQSRIRYWNFLWGLLCVIIILALIAYVYVMIHIIVKAGRRYDELFKPQPNF
ncbi:uncharacterized protein LOC132695776 [Cylas formicarius]|uniref:uncharacterized protein LOC132695776 n=1 Tax=Cylas formicarius TaxID=197179 RepID=UPI0029587BBF|nr:uncharacterized protein LOC132695776 [Cylas formicarius]